LIVAPGRAYGSLPGVCIPPLASGKALGGDAPFSDAVQLLWQRNQALAAALAEV
jgi:hypothetical protein